uniref:Uncharacterized protein n=1 Tax=Sphaerodactylus townsendi TaxID=933632 RepID=A0ACB8E7P8_9SAUR
MLSAVVAPSCGMLPHKTFCKLTPHMRRGRDNVTRPESSGKVSSQKAELAGSNRRAGLLQGRKSLDTK